MLSTPAEPTRLPSRLLQFSLRTLLFAMALVGAFTAGWIAHREWNRRHLVEVISNALEAAEVPVRVESIDNTDVFLTRGRKEDVDKVMSHVQDIEKAASQ